MVISWKNEKLRYWVDMKSGESITAKNIDNSSKYPCYGGNGLRGYTTTYTHSGAYPLIGRQGALCGNVIFACGNFFASEHAVVVTSKSNSDPQFIYYLLTTLQLNKMSESSAQPGLSVNKILDIYCNIPESLSEQRAIAAALSDADGYIAALERLIAKKRNIKKGAMQELLTGKLRLPGFEGEWVERALKDVGGLAKDTINPQLSPTSIFIEYSMPAYDNNRSARRVFGKSMHSARIQITANALLFNKLNVRQRRIWLVASCPENAVCSSEFLPFYSDAVDLHFLSQLLLTDVVTSDFEGMSTGTSNSQKRITPDNFLEYKVLFPPTKGEQTAIAEILSDMDAELSALTEKLNKARNIKQGMMQELLTGRIRLVGDKEDAGTETKPAAKVVELPKREVKPIAKAGGHNHQFDDAVMIAGIVDALYADKNPDKYPLGRKKVQKCLYLLRRHQDESTAAFKKKAAGPYADEVRYKGGEPIAKSANYITTVTTKGKGTIFARGDNINQALDYIESWGRQDDIKWVIDNLKYKKVDELELLATVDMAMCDLDKDEIPVSVASIKHLIATNKEWKAKLKRQTFSDVNIDRAIKKLRILL